MGAGRRVGRTGLSMSLTQMRGALPKARVAGWLAAGVLLGGCQHTGRQGSVPLAGHGVVKPGSPQSYGNFTAKVKKGITTQGDLIELFGGPNITTLDADGTETWVYEKTASHSEVKTEAESSSHLSRLYLFFGLGVSGRASETGKRTGATSVTRSIRTLTVIVKFAPDKTVRDFTARAARF